MNKAAAWRAKGGPLLEVARADLLRSLGVDYVRLPQPPLAFAVQLSALPRWSVRKGAEVIQGVTEEITASYPVSRLGDAIALQRGISKSPENRPDAHATPYVRVANVQPGFVDLSDVQQIDVPPEELPKVALADGDILVCRNNSLDWVGKAAPWAGEIVPCAHDDHVFVVRSNRARVLPSFLNAYLQTDFARAWFISEAQITTNLAGISGSAVTEMPIPLPPLDEQEALGNQFDVAVREAAELCAEGDRVAASARIVAEWEIATGATLS